MGYRSVDAPPCIFNPRGNPFRLTSSSVSVGQVDQRTERSSCLLEISGVVRAGQESTRMHRRGLDELGHLEGGCSEVCFVDVVAVEPLDSERTEEKSDGWVNVCDACRSECIVRPDTAKPR